MVELRLLVGNSAVPTTKRSLLYLIVLLNFAVFEEIVPAGLAKFIPCLDMAPVFGGGLCLISDSLIANGKIGSNDMGIFGKVYPIFNVLNCNLSRGGSRSF